MLVKGFWTICIATVVATIALFAAGSLTMMAAVIFGFIYFGLVFMGMMAVLPSTVGHNAPPINHEIQIEPETVKPAAKTVEAVSVFHAPSYR